MDRGNTRLHIFLPRQMWSQGSLIVTGVDPPDTHLKGCHVSSSHSPLVVCCNLLSGPSRYCSSVSRPDAVLLTWERGVGSHPIVHTSVTLARLLKLVTTIRERLRALYPQASIWKAEGPHPRYHPPVVTLLLHLCRGAALLLLLEVYQRPCSLSPFVVHT